MEPPLHMSYICYWSPKSPCCYLSRWCEGVSRFRVCESEWMPLNAEYAIDGVNEEEAICGGLITKVSAKKGRTEDKKLNYWCSQPGPQKGVSPAFLWEHQDFHSNLWLIGCALRSLYALIALTGSHRVGVG